MQSTSHSVEDLGSRLYAYGEPLEGSFTLGLMQSTSHSLEDWSRVGSAKGAQRGLTRPRRETHEGEQIIATPHSTITESGLSSSAVRLRAVIIYLRPTAWARDPERQHMRSQPAQGPGVTCTVVVPPPRAAREYLGPGPESLLRRLECT